jgi:hypothetical protein
VLGAVEERFGALERQLSELTPLQQMGALRVRRTPAKLAAHYHGSLTFQQLHHADKLFWIQHDYIS